jgi:hypothetical protein
VNFYSARLLLVILVDDGRPRKTQTWDEIVVTFRARTSTTPSHEPWKLAGRTRSSIGTSKSRGCGGPWLRSRTWIESADGWTVRKLRRGLNAGGRKRQFRSASNFTPRKTSPVRAFEVKRAQRVAVGLVALRFRLGTKGKTAVDSVPRGGHQVCCSGVGNGPRRWLRGQADKPATPQSPIPGATHVRHRWMNTTFIELVVDGQIVDLNRVPLPADTPTIDERFEDSQKK